MVSEREIEMAIKAFQTAHTAKVNIPLEQSMRAALEAAARVRAQEPMAKALEQARIIGESYLRFTADGDAELLDPATVFLRHPAPQPSGAATSLADAEKAFLDRVWPRLQNGCYRAHGSIPVEIQGLNFNEFVRDGLCAVLSALTAGKPQPSGWQPIETAPKDGTPIITCVAGFEPMVSARWIEYEGKAMFSEDPDTFMEEDHFREYFHNVSYYPTHWMPLPTPPKAGGDDE